MSLKDFRPDQELFEEPSEPESSDTEPLHGETYQEEINTLKIEKLTNRVTIISIILPCLIGAVLVFAYLDMKERVVDVDTAKQSQFETISKQLEEKLNALDVRIAKNRLDLDSTIPELEKKTVAIQGQLTKKTDARTVKNRMAKIEKQVNAAAAKVETQTNQTSQVLKETQAQFSSTTKQIKEEFALFKDEFDARLAELSEYEQQIGLLRKDFSLMNKKQSNMTREYALNKNLEQQISGLRKDYEARIEKLNALITGLEEKTDRLDRSISAVKATSTGKTTGRPSPRINIDGTNSQPIKEEPLNR